MSKLSNNVKALISLRGGPLHSSSPEQQHQRLLSLLDRLHTSSHISSSKSALLTLGVGTLFAVNSPAGLKSLWRWSGRSRSEAALMREAGLKSISFIGIAKVINNLAVLHEAFSEDGMQKELPTKARREMFSEYVNPTFQRGRSLWNSIYVPHSDKLLSKLGAYHPDLPVHIMESHYSLLLSDPDPSGPLGRTLTSVLAIACLQGQTGVGGQTTSHVFGLKKAWEEAQHQGEDQAEQESEGLQLKEREWLCSDEGSEWILKAVEALREAVTPESANSPVKAKL